MKNKLPTVWICMAIALLMVGIALSLWRSKGAQMIFALFTLNNTRIEFYGKLEDQFGNALPNTPVDFSVQVYSGFRSGVDRGTVVTDAKGLFKISGCRGERLGVVPRKPGYALASLNGGGIYSALYPASERAHPDPKNPVVIKMWKLQGAEPLVGIGKVFKLHYTNQPMCFDLITGTMVATGGDIRITVNRPEGVISLRNPQVWSVKFEAIDGGLVDTSGTWAITYFAPENGYLPARTVSTADRLPEGGIDSFHTGFYLKSRNGQVYAKLGVGIRINENPEDLMYINLGGVANTNSSRNWEGDGNTYRTMQ